MKKCQYVDYICTHIQGDLVNIFNLLTITGPTASGKTAFAVRLAVMLDGEIISADSRQVYREMNLGTGKDYEGYRYLHQNIPYHLIDIHDPGYKYNVYEFQQDFLRSFEEISHRKKLAILTGGTGLYIEAIIRDYELVNSPPNKQLREQLESRSHEELINYLQSIRPNLHNTTDTRNRKQTIRAIEIAEAQKENHDLPFKHPLIRSFILGIKIDRLTRRRRITERLLSRLEEGMVEEVRTLLKKVKPENLIYYGLEYKYITLYITGKISYEEMFNKLEIAIHQFAKRQMTWFRKMERQGIIIHWIDDQLKMDEKVEEAFRLFKQNGVQFVK